MDLRQVSGDGIAEEVEHRLVVCRCASAGKNESADEVLLIATVQIGQRTERRDRLNRVGTNGHIFREVRGAANAQAVFAARQKQPGNERRYGRVEQPRIPGPNINGFGVHHHLLKAGQGHSCRAGARISADVADEVLPEVGDELIAAIRIVVLDSQTDPCPIPCRQRARLPIATAAKRCVESPWQCQPELAIAVI